MVQNISLHCVTLEFSKQENMWHLVMSLCKLGFKIYRCNFIIIDPIFYNNDIHFN